MAIQDTGCLRKQAESKLYCFNPEPDLDNANVGRNQLLLAAVCVLAYCSFLRHRKIFYIQIILCKLTNTKIPLADKNFIHKEKKNG